MRTCRRYADFVVSDDWARVRDAFDQAARWFTHNVEAGSGRWEEMALGEWTVRSLVGHTSRALLTVEAYLGRPASTVEVTTPVEYFRNALAAVGDPAAVAQRGRDAGTALGADPLRAVVDIAERVIGVINAESGEALLTTPVGGMRLVDYLPTRTFELTVHTCDLAVALGVPFEVPEAAAAESLTVLGGLASRPDLAGPLLLAATGRQPLPASFSVL